MDIERDNLLACSQLYIFGNDLDIVIWSSVSVGAEYNNTVSSLADPAVGFGGGQLGEVTQARVPPKPKTPRIWPTIFGEWSKITYKNKNIYLKRKTKKSGFRSLVHHGSPWLVRWEPDSF